MLLNFLPAQLSDHIMIIIGYTVDSSGHVTGFYHNDYWKRTVSLITSKFSTRQNCEQDTHPEQPYSYCLPYEVDYGLAILGNNDPLGETFPTYLVTDMYDEPDWGAEDKIFAKPILFNHTLHVSGLIPGPGARVCVCVCVRASVLFVVVCCCLCVVCVCVSVCECVCVSVVST
jgi:hypothetical protein